MLLCGFRLSHWALISVQYSSMTSTSYTSSNSTQMAAQLAPILNTIIQQLQAGKMAPDLVKALRNDLKSVQEMAATKGPPMPRNDATFSQVISDLQALMDEPNLPSQGKAFLTTQVAAWMADADLRVERDAVGNVWGYLDGRNRDAGIIATGSHIDSQNPGGRFDGALGVVAGIVALAALRERAGQG